MASYRELRKMTLNIEREVTLGDIPAFLKIPAAK
jgi:hypothetical protein